MKVVVLWQGIHQSAISHYAVKGTKGVKGMKMIKGMLRMKGILDGTRVLDTLVLICSLAINRILLIPVSTSGMLRTVSRPSRSHMASAST